MTDKKLKKKLASILLGALLITLLTGCGNNKAGDSETTDLDTTNKESSVTESNKTDTDVANNRTKQ